MTSGVGRYRDRPEQLDELSVRPKFMLSAQRREALFRAQHRATAKLEFWVGGDLFPTMRLMDLCAYRPLVHGSIIMVVGMVMHGWLGRK